MEPITAHQDNAGFYQRSGKYRWLVAEWMMSTDHKRIGLMYLMAILSFFFPSASFWVS